MNAKIATLFVTAITIAACSAGGAPSPSPTTRPPTQPPTTAPTNRPSNPPTSSPTAPPSASPSAPPASAGTVSGRQFLSVNVTAGGEPRPLVAGTRIRLTFQDGSLSANAGCNIIGGSYEIEGGKLVFSGASMTEMACEEPRMAQDDWLVSFLGSEPSLTIDGDNLTLTDGEVTIALLDSEVAEPDKQLTGQTWTLSSLIQGDAVSSVPAGVIATLTFGEDGSVDVNAGCNSGGGTYTVDGESVTFGDIVTTKMACMGPQMQVENAVLQVLSTDGLTFSIDANVLTISAGDVGLQFSAS